MREIHPQLRRATTADITSDLRAAASFIKEKGEGRWNTYVKVSGDAGVLLIYTGGQFGDYAASLVRSHGLEPMHLDPGCSAAVADLGARGLIIAQLQS